MKRGNDNSQLRSEEVEALNDDESEERGNFQRASADVLATRKIFKSKRPTGNEPISVVDKQLRTTTSFSNEDTIVPAIAQPVNPFSNFQGLVAKQNTSFNAISNFSLAGNNTTTTSSPISASSKAEDSSVLVPDANDQYKKKMRKLNTAFHSWISRQMLDHPLSLWKDGIKDYIKYADALTNKFDSDEKEAGVVVSSPNPPPAPSASFGGTFGTNQFSSTVPLPLKPHAVTANSFTFGAGTAPNSSTSTSSFVFNPTATIGNSFSAPLNTGFSAPLNTGFSAPLNTGFSAPLNTGFSAPLNTGFSAPLNTGFSAPLNTGFSAPLNTGFSAPLNTGFSAPLNTGFTPSSSTFLGASVDGGGGEDEAGEDEGEPILEPEKVLRNDADTDDILLEVPCKLFGFSKDSNEWKDTGKGLFRVTRSVDTKKQRMLVRNPIGKLTFNAGFYKTMKIEKVKGGLRFSAFVAQDDAVVGGGGGGGGGSKVELKNFMVKIKEADLPNALVVLDAGVASCQ